jgi:hypothetical protein
MLAGLDRADRPFRMVMVQERHIDGIDIRIPDQFIVGTVCSVQAVFGGRHPARFFMPARDADEFAVCGRPDGRRHFFRNGARSENAPPYLVHAAFPPGSE